MDTFTLLKCLLLKNFQCHKEYQVAASAISKANFNRKLYKLV